MPDIAIPDSELGAESKNPVRRYYRKLVRDNILESLKQKGLTFSAETARGDSLLHYALKKLVEEAEEAKNAGSKEELSKELGDLKDVILLIQTLSEITDVQIEQDRLAKLKSAGGFINGDILISIDEAKSQP